MPRIERDQKYEHLLRGAEDDWNRLREDLPENVESGKLIAA